MFSMLNWELKVQSEEKSQIFKVKKKKKIAYVQPIKIIEN